MWFFSGLLKNKNKSWLCNKPIFFPMWYQRYHPWLLKKIFFFHFLVFKKRTILFFYLVCDNRDTLVCYRFSNGLLPVFNSYFLFFFGGFLGNTIGIREKNMFWWFFENRMLLFFGLRQFLTNGLLTVCYRFVDGFPIKNETFLFFLLTNHVVRQTT